MKYVIFTPDGIPGHISDDPRPGSEPVEGLDVEFLAAHRRNEKGEWVVRDPVKVPEPTPEEIAAREAEAVRAAREAEEAARKWNGVEFEGVWCSATRDDQNGLTAVFLAIQMEGADFQPTRFLFENGNALVIHLGNWRDFAEVWRPFRKSFFKVE